MWFYSKFIYKKRYVPPAPPPPPTVSNSWTNSLHRERVNCPQLAMRCTVPVIHSLEQPTSNYLWHKHFLFKNTFGSLLWIAVNLLQSSNFFFIFQTALAAPFKDIFPGTDSQSEISNTGQEPAGALSTQGKDKLHSLTGQLNWYMKGLADDPEPKTQYLNSSPLLTTEEHPAAWCWAVTGDCHVSTGRNPTCPTSLRAATKPSLSRDSPSSACTPDEHVCSEINFSPSQSKLVRSRWDLHGSHYRFAGDLACSPTAEGTSFRQHNSVGAHASPMSMGKPELLISRFESLQRARPESLGRATCQTLSYPRFFMFMKNHNTSWYLLSISRFLLPPLRDL